MGYQELRELPALTTEHREMLRQELARDDLNIFSAVRLAQEACAVDNFDSAVMYLRSDADKIRTVSPALYALITYQLPR